MSIRACVLIYVRPVSLVKGRIQDFLDGGEAILKFEAKNLLFTKIFVENCMKMKEIVHRGGAYLAPKAVQII